LAVGALALVAVLAIAGCGGGGSSSSSGSSGGETTESGGTSTAGESGGTTTTESGGGTTTGGATTAATPEIEEEAATTATAGGGAAAATKPAVIKVTNTTDLGKVIVNAEGMTMYDFHKDKGTTSACYGACAEAWPPLLTKGMPTASGGAEASLLGVTKRKDGTEQVTYNGHPLYGFVEDKKPGEANGNDVDAFGAQWYALMPNGEEPADG
jgi:predicted lipoprotein with Yx(FWY)xxD motif